MLYSVHDVAPAPCSAARGLAAEEVLPLVEDLDAIIWVADAATFRFSYVSGNAEALLGYPLECWCDEPDFWLRHLHPEDCARASTFSLTAVREGRDHEFEFRMVGVDGRVVWLRNIAHVVRDAEGRPSQLRGLMVNITERKRAEIELHQVLSSARCLLWHGVVEEIAGELKWQVRMSDEAAAQRFLPLVVPPGKRYDWAWYYSKPEEDRVRMAEIGNHALRTGQCHYAQEFRCRRADGEVRYLFEDVQVEQHHSGLWHLVGVCTDITERKQAEAAERERLREQAAREQAEAAHAQVTRILEGLVDGYIGLDEEGKILYVNPRVEQYLAPLGLTRDQLVGRSNWDVFSQPEVAFVREEVAAVMRDRELRTFEIHFAPLGRWFDVRATPIENGCGLFIRDITKRKESEAEKAALLQREIETRKRMEALAAEREAILCDLTEAVLITDPEGRLTFLNAAASRLLGEVPLGCPAGELAQHCRLLTEDGDAFPGEHLPLVRAALAGETATNVLVRVGQPGGVQQVALTSASPVSGADGTPLGAVAIFRDITEQHSLEQHKDALLEALADRDRRKDEFLAMLAHELRNPLAPIRTAVELMRANPDDRSALDRARRVVDRQVQQLARLVDDLLDVSRITRGLITLRPEPIDLRELVERAVQTSQPLIEARRHHLEVSLPANPLLLRVDPARIEQVVTNLLNNAAKYTEPDGVIRLRVEERGGEAVVEITDNGAGISPELLPDIFDVFVQASRSPDRSQGGLGVGLTLVRSLVEMHGGAVEAESAGLGHGSTFRVRLPVQGPTSNVPGPVSPETGPIPLDLGHGTLDLGLRVLVVDDNADAADTLAELLPCWGHTVHVAYEGHTALRMAMELRPDVVLLDIGLPGMDGYEVALRLRQELAEQPPLLVAITGYGQAEDQDKSAAAGFAHHFVKPLDPAELEQLLARIASREGVREGKGT